MRRRQSDDALDEHDERLSGALLVRVADVLEDQAVHPGEETLLAIAGQRLPDASLSVANLLELPFADDQFDLVLCLEVLEHLPDPAAGLAELARVSGRDIVVSVPHEPWFRLGSLARGKYLKTWGNHPEHVNHWNPRSLREFLATQVEVVEVKSSTPWLIARCRPIPAG